MPCHRRCRLDGVYVILPTRVAPRRGSVAAAYACDGHKSVDDGIKMKNDYPRRRYRAATPGCRAFQGRGGIS